MAANQQDIHWAGSIAHLCARSGPHEEDKFAGLGDHLEPVRNFFADAIIGRHNAGSENRLRPNTSGLRGRMIGRAMVLVRIAVHVDPRGAFIGRVDGNQDSASAGSVRLPVPSSFCLTQSAWTSSRWLTRTRKFEEAISTPVLLSSMRTVMVFSYCAGREPLNAARHNNARQKKAGDSIHGFVDSVLGADGKRSPSAARIVSPGIVGLPVGAGLVGAGMNIVDAGVGLIEGVHGVAGIRHPGSVAFGHGVFGDGLEIAVLDQVVERLRGFLLIHGVGVDGGAQGVQVFLEHRFARMLDGLDVAGHGDHGQNADDGHDDHQLDQRKARVLLFL